MLYVFHVDVGRMMNFDMTVALSSVENLKETIERLHSIPAANIVLLVSGGEMLTQSTQVSYYSAGTDTNPIYMFLTGDAKLPPAALQNEPDLDLREQVERSLELPAVYETVVTRAQLAQRMHDLARDEERLCERLVHDQHLQQQGWSAVVANMEDLTDEFRQRYRNFCAFFDRHLEKRSNYLELLHNFGDDLTQLERIPILPGLMPLAEEDFHGFDEFLDTDEVFSRSSAQESVLFAGVSVAIATSKTESGSQVVDSSNNADSEEKSSTSPNKKLKMGNESAEDQQQQTTSTSSTARRCNLNLLQWITSKENHNTLKLMSDECTQGLGTFNESVYEKLKVEVQNIIKIAEQGDVKEIKGLGDRLCRLEEFKYRIKGMVQDQKELSTAFKQNQTRAINLRDASILPDLCASHQSQLVVMLQNHQKIRELSRGIAKAKDELGSNLHMRLKRIVLIENSMSEFDNRLLFYHRCLRRAERHISIIEQIHQAPSIYVAAVTEVVRRKIFSGEFRLWASKLAEDFDTIHSEEIKRRQVFNDSFEGHFLNILFPGMCDMPPAFANENPLVFDTRLPNITKADIDMLSSQLPDLASQTQLPDMEPVINFFVSRSGAHQKERLEELLRQQVTAALGTTISETVATSSEKPAQHQRLGELQKERDTGCDESETDTETEFEQVPSSLNTVATSTSEITTVDTIARSTATEPLLVQSAATLTEENHGTEKSTACAEIERLRSFLDNMSKLAVDCIRLARVNLNTFRTETEMRREDLQAELLTLNENWTVIRMQLEAREQEFQLASAQEKELLRNELLNREKNLQILQHQANTKDVLQTKCNDLETQVAQLCVQLNAAQLDKERAIGAARDQLIHEHKTEIESLRCRFKLMTSMDRSPSDSSLEKIERPVSLSSNEHQMMDFGQHEAILAHLRAALEAEKVRAINAAVEVERSLWQSKMFPINSESVMANVGLLKDLLEDKERQLDQLREKDLMLTKENYQLLSRLDSLTNEEGSWQKEKIEYLLRDKVRLEEELTFEKSRRLEMETSIAGLRGSTYDQVGAAIPRSKLSGSNQKYIVLESCGKGDIVFVVWSVRHSQFMVVQDSQSLYFLHSDSLAGLNLRLPTPTEGASNGEEVLPIPMPYYAIGRVTEKEYCQARKDENRYRVTRGSKFYRIKLAPLLTKQAARRERLESFSTSISRSDLHSEGGAAAFVTTPATGARDVVDTAVATSPSLLNVVSSTQQPQSFKERTISISSVTEEDDEPLSLLSDRCRYISVSEEEELPGAGGADDLMRETTVITEQPTASSKLKMDLMMAATDLPANEALMLASTTSTLVATATLPTTAALICRLNEGATSIIPTSIGTSEDSDEYRSLDGGKDEETDFPISE